MLLETHCGDSEGMQGNLEDEVDDINKLGLECELVKRAETTDDACQRIREEGIALVIIHYSGEGKISFLRGYRRQLENRGEEIARRLKLIGASRWLDESDRGEDYGGISYGVKRAMIREQCDFILYEYSDLREIIRQVSDTEE